MRSCFAATYSAQPKHTGSKTEIKRESSQAYFLENVEQETPDIPVHPPKNVLFAGIAFGKKPTPSNSKSRSPLNSIICRKRREIARTSFKRTCVDGWWFNLTTFALHTLGFTGAVVTTPRSASRSYLASPTLTTCCHGSQPASNLQISLNANIFQSTGHAKPSGSHCDLADTISQRFSVGNNVGIQAVQLVSTQPSFELVTISTLSACCKAIRSRASTAQDSSRSS
mmetsp:Transcript_22089/g.58460  ORF Transcript_22089/g.58460 Transcript_22089/m.58460 type:complete len:226 (-) Transcript_22089:434-1111(-)